MKDINPEFCKDATNVYRTKHFIVRQCVGIQHDQEENNVSLRGTLGSSLRSPAEGEGHEGFPPPPRQRPRESFFNASRGPSPLP